MSTAVKVAIVTAAGAVIVGAIAGGVSCYTSSKKEAGAPNVASSSSTSEPKANATAAPVQNMKVEIAPPPSTAAPARTGDQAASSGGVNIGGDIRAPTIIAPNSKGPNSINLGTPPREITASDRKVFDAAPAKTTITAINLVTASRQPSAPLFVKKVRAYFEKRGYKSFGVTEFTGGSFVGVAGHPGVFEDYEIVIGDREDGVEE
jgi:hypothetical protein